jgi:signal transduction histidine kinase
MKRLSLKTKLVLLHTGLMTLVVCALLGVLFSVSSQEILTNVQNTLEERVSQSVDEVEYDKGRLEFDSELLVLENGVYLSVYDPGDGQLLYGKLPYGFAYDLPLSDGELRTVTSGETDFYVMDLKFPVEGYGDLVLRGIVSISDAEKDFRFTLRLALFLSPVIVLLTALCGYLLSSWALRPVAQITQTVRNIQQEQDLSKRVRLGEGRDEIYTLAQTFDSLLDAVQVSFEREKQFTSDVAHELRTPLTVTLAQCESLLEREDLSPEARRETEVIFRKARSMADMVSQLLLLSRADQGRERLTLERLDLSELSQMEAEEFIQVAAQKDITLSADIQPGLFVTADQTLLLRLWENLLRNAVTYGREKGHIWMSLKEKDGRAVLQVRDDGIGIAQEDLPKIWDRFYQADPSRSGDSSGLGLSMVKWIVQAHGGEIHVESTLGQGSVFTAELPLADREEA